MTEHIAEKLKLLPDDPGCYLMKNSEGKIIYVGKAKNLKNRVRSYFTGAHNAKTTKLVSEIRDFDFIITASELESLVLEINLIKHHDPRYNIMLTDDKSYPYIVLTNEANPRLFVTRNANKKKKDGKYFGPYPNVSSARKTVALLNMLYPIRKCFNIPKIECLYFHMHQCLAPCINKEKFDYFPYKQGITSFLNGDASNVLNDLNEKMEQASLDLNFEKAIEYRDLIEDIKITIAKQKITTSDLSSKDIIGFFHDEDEMSVQILYMRNGSIVQNYHTVLSFIGDPSDAMTSFIMQTYQNEATRPKEILISNDVDLASLSEALHIDVVFPQRGKKKEMTDMAIINAKKTLDDKRLLYKNKVLKKIDTIEELGNLLNIPAPYYLEAFDNSNLYGEYPVSAMVVYKDGRPSPKDYRKYHIKMVEGANDYETMKEVIYRRYLRLKMEDSPFPDLIVMDGGEIQVNAALETLRSLNIEINVCGIKKDNNHKARCLVFNNQEYPITKNSDIYLLIANISQTVHDYAITFFRSTKAKGMFSSRLDGIANLGPKRKEKLLKHFISIDKMKSASINEFQEIGISKELAINIINHLNNKNSTEKDNQSD